MSKKKSSKKSLYNLNPQAPSIHSETKKAAAAVLFFAFSALSLLSAFGLGGKIGNSAFSVFWRMLGWGAYLLSFAFAAVGFVFAKSMSAAICSTTIISTLAMFLSALSIIQLVFGKHTGGQLGYFLGSSLENMFDFSGSLVISFAVFLASLLIALNISLQTLWKKFSKKKSLSNSKDEIPEEDNKKNPAQTKDDYNNTSKIPAIQPMFKKIQIKEEPEKEFLESKTQLKPEILIKSGTNKSGGNGYKGFSLEILAEEEKYSFKSSRNDKNFLDANANVIKRTLENFNISVEMQDINVGPAVTQYSLKPAEGVKLSKIVALQNDLALSLAAHPIRIEAPIPGKPLVGIEVPNKNTVTVRLKSILTSEAFKNKKTSLSFGLGLDVSGSPVIADLTKMPHLLVAGSTGSGKSVCVNTIISSLLYCNSPKILRFILVDPKRVELTCYNGIPHLLCPVIVDSNKTINALKWAIKEMEERLKKLQEAGARDIESYNIKSGGELMPYVVFVIDELADLMANNTNEVEAGIVRLAQMARAVGIHLIVSTQRPSVEVITGLIKANIPARIAFRVASQIDSRTILDSSGAEKLLGSGDMLFLAGNLGKPKRIQGAFLAEEEVKRIVEQLSSQKENVLEQQENIPTEENILNSSSLENFGANPDCFNPDSDLEDDLYEDAKEIVLQAGKASASLLQRRLRVGYSRAARLLDILEEHKIIGPADGARPRNVFYDSVQNGGGDEVI